MSKRVHMEPVVPRKKRGENESSDAIRSCCGVRRIRSAAGDGGENRIVRQRAAGIRESSNNSPKSGSESRSGG